MGGKTRRAKTKNRSLAEALPELTDDELFSPQVGEQAIAELAQGCGISEDEFLRGVEYRTILEDPSGHCSPELLEGLALGELSRKDRDVVERHLRVCRFCNSCASKLRQLGQGVTSLFFDIEKTLTRISNIKDVPPHPMG